MNAQCFLLADSDSRPSHYHGLGDLTTRLALKPTMSKDSNKKTPLGTHLLAGGVAGLSEALVCHPLDTIKVRMQLSKSGRGKGVSSGTCCHTQASSHGIRPQDSPGTPDINTPPRALSQPVRIAGLSFSDSRADTYHRCHARVFAFRRNQEGSWQPAQ